MVCYRYITYNCPHLIVFASWFAYNTEKNFAFCKQQGIVSPCYGFVEVLGINADYYFFV